MAADEDVRTRFARGQGTVSGAPTEAREFFVWRLADDGRILHWREFLEREEAEAAFLERGG